MVLASKRTAAVTVSLATITSARVHPDRRVSLAASPAAGRKDWRDSMAVKGGRQATSECRHERASLLGLCYGAPDFVLGRDRAASWQGLRIVVNCMVIPDGVCA